MRAIIAERYGPPSSLKLSDEPEPAFDPDAQPDEVLVEIGAASINPADWHLITGTPWLVRLAEGFRRPKRRIPGVDLAGRIVAVGRHVSSVEAGDEVFGYTPGGAWAERVIVPAKNVVRRPENLTGEQAATLGVAAFTALQGVRDKGRVQAGHRVLVNGAAGGVGQFCVQIAAAAGAEVTGVCSNRNVGMVGELGAARVVDYADTDFTAEGQQYDVIIDNVGNHGARALLRCLEPAGQWVSISGPKKNRALGPIPATMARLIRFLLSSRRGVVFVANENPEDLAVLRDMAARGDLSPVVERTYPPEDVSEALDYLATGHARAKLVVVM